ncbi:hypothetical protein SNEBB_003085 [Seison nebaliae]|nr:hypothetical protein SNEBB_003085 [Seison nebaliae]
MARRRKTKKSNNSNPNAVRRKFNALKIKKQSRIKCDLLQPVWNDHLSINKNMKDVGISNDPNQIPLKDTERTEKHKIILDSIKDFANSHEKADAKCTTYEEEFLSYLLDKYGEFELDNSTIDMSKVDWEKMRFDRRNIYQYTPSQLRKMMKRFVNNRKQFGKYVQCKIKSIEGK